MTSKLLFNKPIIRYYYDVKSGEWKKGTFVAGGNQADGHLAYDRIDEDGNTIEGEETSYIQVRSFGRLIMEHI